MSARDTVPLSACLYSACREGCGRGMADRAQRRAWRAGNAPSVTPGASARPVLYLPRAALRREGRGLGPPRGQAVLSPASA